MGKIIVAGLINIETTLKIEQFPIDYTAVRYPFFGIQSSVSGVGYNISKALTTLGHSVDFLSLVGSDLAGTQVKAELNRIRVNDKKVLAQLDATPQSVILYDSDGKRMINTDLKDIQEASYPLLHLNLEDCDLAVLCNINFSRPMLARVKQAGIPIATDVHAIASLDDTYNQDYMTYADILFMSHERLPMSAHDWIHSIWGRFGKKIVVVGMGGEGALLGHEDTITHIPARAMRPIVNTIGAGDALFSAFIHGYSQTHNPQQSLEKAVIFAGYKIGERGAADGFLTADQLANMA